MADSLLSSTKPLAVAHAERPVPQEAQRQRVETVFIARFAEFRRIAAASGLQRADAEDALQEVYVQAVRQAPAGRSDEQLFRWLARVTVNRCLLTHRQRGRWQRALHAVKAAWPRQRAPAAADVTRADERQRVRTALDALPAELLAPTVLYYYCELPTAEVAAILEIPVGTVHRRLYDARRRLADVLQDEDK
jgi:RNA polymerase sigma-70 factor (ECF subfamily)